jgi:hypothetical protein
MIAPEPSGPHQPWLQRRAGAFVALLSLAALAGCAAEKGPAPPPDDLAFACEDGRVVRFLEERPWSRAVLTTITERVTMERADDDTGAERFVTRTGWEFRVNDDEALLTSPGREQTYCRQRRVRWD